MRIGFFDSHSYEVTAFKKELVHSSHEIVFFDVRLTSQTARLAKGCDCVCSFVNDRLDRDAIKILSEEGVKLIVLRCAGFNHVDLAAAQEFKIPVLRVPEYSPYAVAEHAVALILTLNRKIHRAHTRVRDGNFSLDGLVGFDLHGKTIGVLGTGRIGSVFCKIMNGFGCKILAYDRDENTELKNIGVRYTDFQEVVKQADILSLHLPLTPETHHLIDAKTLSLCKKELMLINTSRGGLIDTKALIEALKAEKISSAGLDVYEEEEGIFFKNLSETILKDDQLARLLTFPNVLITSHQAFLTEDALKNIAHTTLQNATAFELGKALNNEVHADTHLATK